MPAPERSLEDMLSDLENVSHINPSVLHPMFVGKLIVAVRAALSPVQVGDEKRTFCAHCDLRIYAQWRHHGSNLEPCYGGLDTFATPAVRVALSPKQGELPELDITPEERATASASLPVEMTPHMCRATALVAKEESLCLARQLRASNAEVGRLRDEVDTCRQLESAKLPCGHYSRYGFTDDGGKTGYCTLCETGRLREQYMSLLISTPTQPKWVCFHCDFSTSVASEAEAHFGDRDDAEEFTPLCKWWKRMDEGERAETLQSTIQQLNEAMDGNSTSFVAGREKGQEECLEAVRKCVWVRQAEAAILALPKVGE